MNFNKRLMIIAGVLGFVVVVLLVVYLMRKSSHNGGGSGPSNWKGLVLFDIDGTLSAKTGQNNTAVVQACLDAGYVVGVCTAGSTYTPQNVATEQWMPQNLYTFMSERSFDTFNDVGNGYLNGKMNKEAYAALKIPANVTGGMVPGYKKGFAMDMTAKLYGISPDKCIILCDDDPKYRAGATAYNPKYTLVCANVNDSACNGGLTVENVVAGLKKCA